MSRLYSFALSLAFSFLAIQSASADLILPLDPIAIDIQDVERVQIEDEKNTGYTTVYQVKTTPGEQGCTVVMNNPDGGLVWINTDSDRDCIILSMRSGTKQRTLVRYTGEGTESNPGTATAFEY